MALRRLVGVSFAAEMHMNRALSTVHFVPASPLIPLRIGTALCRVLLATLLLALPLTRIPTEALPLGRSS